MNTTSSPKRKGIRMTGEGRGVGGFRDTRSQKSTCRALGTNGCLKKMRAVGIKQVGSQTQARKA